MGTGENDRRVDLKAHHAQRQFPWLDECVLSIRYHYQQHFRIVALRESITMAVHIAVGGATQNRPECSVVDISRTQRFPRTLPRRKPQGMTQYAKITVKPKSVLEKLVFQIRLLLWKRYQESTKSKWELAKVLMPAWLFWALLILLYEGFGFFAAGGLEPFFVPMAFWVFVQRIVVQIMHEKSSRLQESMRMMGLIDIAYWLGYFISDGVILGFIMSFTCAIMSTGGLFNDANFGVVLGMLFVFCLSAVPFAFFLSSFFDTPQTSGQATLAVLIGTLIWLSTCTVFCQFQPISTPLSAQGFT
jgi:hypothetical protein